MSFPNPNSRFIGVQSFVDKIPYNFLFLLIPFSHSQEEKTLILQFLTGMSFANALSIARVAWGGGGGRRRCRAPPSAT
ncbi:serine/threonine-protein kinase Nek2-like [Iris pallida]|uniref:Serine/threonine-protein kinase Nek2-like n=1 Tax=Iris pallida TaxID=29817 RepID=A0AAX6H382_IRIPA|nr:serine/threonine-protein kinase Nek2-like [Iris pallida]